MSTGHIHSWYSSVSALFRASVVALLLCLVSFGSVDAAKIAAPQGTLSHESRYRDKQGIMSEREFKEALAVCEANGYAAEIRRMPNADLLQVIAIRESRCNPAAENDVSGALGIFQIIPSTIRGLARLYTGGNQDEIIRRIKNNPALNTRMASQDILEYHLRTYGPVGGQCYYAGQIRQFRDTGSCYAYRENEAYRPLLRGGHYESTTVTDIDNPNYGNIEITSGGQTFTTLNCQDGSKKLAQALAKSARAYRVGSAATTQEAFFAGLEADKALGADGGYHPRGSIKATYCISKLMWYFDFVRALLAGSAWIEGVIAQIVMTVLDSLCEYVIEAIVVPIENLLNSFCIPIPNISFEMNLDNLSRESCNGLTIGSAVAVGAGLLTPAEVQSGLHTALTDAIPAINSLPTRRVESPNLAEPLRRLFGTRNGVEDVR